MPTPRAGGPADDFHLSPAFEAYRLPQEGRCWWCGAKATTREHKFKASDLRRIATTDGVRDLDALHKVSPTRSGPLRTLKRGSEVQWGLNLCGPCNNTRSQPFDVAYDRFVGFLRANGDTLSERRSLDWTEVYGAGWAEGSADLVRYFVKQFGCMMATQHLPVPDDARAFLDGATRCPSVQSVLYRDHRPAAMHRKLRRSGDPEGALSFIGLPATKAFADGTRLTGADYMCRLAYLVFDVRWRDGQDQPSFHETQFLPLPIINSRLRDRADWLLNVEVVGLADRLRNRMSWRS